MDLFILLLSLFLFMFISFLCWNKIIKENNNKCCYMLHYECFHPPQERCLTPETAARIAFRNKRINIEEFRFLLKTYGNSGIGDEAYIPKTILEGREDCPSFSNDSLPEVDEIAFDTLDKIFRKTGISPSEVDILVVNVSLLSPAPSFTSRIVNRYKMREDIRTYNLTGMGCSASIVAVDIVQQLFKVHRNMNAIVVSTECMGSDWYMGNERSFMLSNCLFRQGGCSMLFTNNQTLKHQALIKLKCLVRTHIGSDDMAYKCCFGEEDDQGYHGFRLTKHLPKAAIQGLTQNLKSLAPKILPLKELFRYLIFSRVNLKAGVQHFCIHPGGKAIIDKVGQGLELSEYDVEPSRMTLYRWGNTSSAGFWYVLGYMEAKKRLKKGDKILMLSFGAGFKCNNCLWEVMRDDLGDRNVWDDRIDDYPRKSTISAVAEKYNWINDETLNFVMLH